MECNILKTIKFVQSVF